MVRLTDYEQRRNEVLAATIDAYIKTATPVSSQELCENFSCSSATIRNIFAELEERGYLTHPYTSAGRIPTHKGYRYYVDYLLSPSPPYDIEKEDIAYEYQECKEEMEDLLEKTSSIISKITHYAGIVSMLNWKDKILYKGTSFILEQPEFKNLERTKRLLRILEEGERLIRFINRDLNEITKVYIGEELEYPEIEDCAMVMATYSFKARPYGRLAILGPMRMEYARLIPTLEYISRLLSKTLEEKYGEERRE